MRIYEDALAQSILEHLHSTGCIVRKNLYTPFTGYAYKYYARVVKRLVNEGYLETLTKYKRVHIQITPKGTQTLNEIYEKQNKSVADIKSVAKSKKQKRQTLVADVIGLCVANGIAVAPEDKPPLEDIVVFMRDPLPEKTREQFESKLKSGIFYSTGEIRTAHRKVLGENEIANWTRLVGIIMLDSNITYVYSVDKDLIKWVVSCEDRTVKTITQFLMMSKAITDKIVFYEHPSCIVCGKGFTMVPKIVYGRKWGRIDSNKKDNYRAKIASDHINSHNLAKVFSSAYYVTSDKRGVEDFKFALMLNESSKNALSDAWFEKTKNVNRITHFEFHQGLTAKGERVVYMPYMDMIELEFYKRQATPCHFVISKGTQEAVSRVMGQYVLSIKSLKGENLKHGSYDNTGTKIEQMTFGSA